MVYEAIKKLVCYGLETGLLEPEDRIYTVNQILDVLKLDEYEEPEEEFSGVNLEETLGELLDYACGQGIIEDSIVYPVSYTHLDVYKRQGLSLCFLHMYAWCERSSLFVITDFLDYTVEAGKNQSLCREQGKGGDRHVYTG